MSQRQLYKLIRENIPTKSEHILSYLVHGYLNKTGKRHPFIVMLCDALLEIEQASPGYAEEMIGRIGRYTGQDLNTAQQIYQVFAEILIIRRAVQIADNENGSPYLIHEPGAKQDMPNPEIRSRVDGINYAIEVKTPHLIEHSLKRHTELQLTSRLPLRRLTDGIDVINPLDTKMKSYLDDTKRKYEAYVKNVEYQDDVRLLFVVWDDYIHEPIAALLSSLSGLFTEKTFVRTKKGEAEPYAIIDGVFIVRHLHQFQRGIHGIELANEFKHAFEFYVDRNPFAPAFIQNPNGRKVPEIIREAFDGIPPDALNFVSEYQLIDWVDWRSGVGFTGLSKIPLDKHDKFFRAMRTAAKGNLKLTIPDVASFGALNIKNIAERHDLESDYGFNKFLEEAARAVKIGARMQSNWESLELERVERASKKNDLPEERNLIREQLLMLEHEAGGVDHKKQTSMKDKKRKK